MHYWLFFFSYLSDECTINHQVALYLAMLSNALVLLSTLSEILVSNFASGFDYIINVFLESSKMKFWDSMCTIYKSNFIMNVTKTLYKYSKNMFPS